MFNFKKIIPQIIEWLEQEVKHCQAMSDARISAIFGLSNPGAHMVAPLPIQIKVQKENYQTEDSQSTVAWVPLLLITQVDA